MEWKVRVCGRGAEGQMGASEVRMQTADDADNMHAFLGIML